MSEPNGMLAQAIRSVTYVPTKHLGTINDLAHKLQGVGADEFAVRLKKALRAEGEEQPGTPVLDLSAIPEMFHLSATFWYKTFGRVPDFSGVSVPEIPADGNKYLVCFAPVELIDWTEGQPKEGIFQARKRLFQTWKYTNEPLDVAIPIEKDQRDLRNGSYAFLMRNSETPDKGLMNLSTTNIVKINIKTSTDMEYAIFSGMFFLEHGYHPDRKTWTLNTGSRNRNGGVPGADWRGGKSRVDWYGVADRHPNLGSRRVIV